MTIIKKNIILFLFVFASMINMSFAQNAIHDTGFNELKTINEVTVTTTRTEKSIEDIS